MYANTDRHIKISGQFNNSGIYNAHSLQEHANVVDDNRFNRIIDSTELLNIE